MTTTAAPDLSHEFPRSGRDLLGGYAWLARLADKARADANGTAGEYVAYCPLSLGFLAKAGVSRRDFDQRIRSGASDNDLVKFMDEHVSAEQKQAANDFVLVEMKSHVDEQDAEEGR